MKSVQTGQRTIRLSAGPGSSQLQVCGPGAGLCHGGTATRMLGGTDRDSISNPFDNRWTAGGPPVYSESRLGESEKATTTDPLALLRH